MGLPDSAFALLQRVLHAAARFFLALRPWDHISSALQTLHWLLVRQRITYKLCILMHDVAFGYAPAYLLDAVVPLSLLPGRAHLRSVDSGEYDIPRTSSSMGSRAFSVVGPKAWNQLPTSVHHINCVATFKLLLKTILFTEAYSVSPWRYLSLIRNFCFTAIFTLFSATVHFVSGTIQISIVIVIVNTHTGTGNTREFWQ